MNVLKVYHHPKLLAISKLENLHNHEGSMPQNISRNIKRPTRSKNGIEIFGNFAERVYSAGTNNPNHPGGEVEEGGGPQTLTATSMRNFCVKFKTLLLHANLNEINILWIGIGMAEEAILVAKYFEAQQPPIRIQIYGLDISDQCVTEARRLITLFNCQNSIQVECQNFFNFTPNGNYTCTYTSAAVNEIFNLKLLHTSIQCKAQWCFHSSNSSHHFKHFKFLKVGFATNWTKGRLTGSGETRNVTIMTLPFLRLSISNLKKELNGYSRRKLIDEFKRNFISSDKIYTLYVRSRIENETTLTISFQNLIGHHYADEYVRWIDFNIDLATENLMRSNLEERVVPYHLRERIMDHFVNQYLSEGVPQKLFPDFEGDEQVSESVSESDIEGYEHVSESVSE